MTTLTLRDVDAIGSSAFSGCTSLEALDLGNTVSIGRLAFQSCTALEDLYIPDSVKTLALDNQYCGPFYQCTSLKTISVGGVETLESGMLKTGSQKLESLTVRGTVKTVGANAFSSVDAFSLYTYSWTNNGYSFDIEQPVALILEEGVESIGDSAFSGCTMFTSVSLPSTITAIGSSAFSKCSRLSWTLFKGTEAGWGAVSVGSGNQPLLDKLLYYHVEDFILPAQLTSIEPEAFSGIAAVSVLLPETVTSIGDHAFADCEALRQVIIPESVTTIGENVFDGCGPLLIVGVSGSTAESYARENDFAFMERPAA